MQSGIDTTKVGETLVSTITSSAAQTIVDNILNSLKDDLISKGSDTQSKKMRETLSNFVVYISELNTYLDPHNSLTIKDVTDFVIGEKTPFRTGLFNGSSTGNVLDSAKFPDWLKDINIRIDRASAKLDLTNPILKNIRGKLTDFVTGLILKSDDQLNSALGRRCPTIVYVALLETILHFMDKLSVIKTEEQAKKYLDLLTKVNVAVAEFRDLINVNNETARKNFILLTEFLNNFTKQISAPLNAYVNQIPLKDNLKNTKQAAQEVSEDISGLAVLFINSTEKLDGESSILNLSSVENAEKVKDELTKLFTKTTINNPSMLSSFNSEKNERNPYINRVKNIIENKDKEEKKSFIYYSLLCEALPAIERGENVTEILNQAKEQYLNTAKEKLAFPALGRAIMSVSRSESKVEFEKMIFQVPSDDLKDVDAVYRNLAKQDPDLITNEEWQFIEKMIQVIDVSSKLSQFCHAMENFIDVVGKIGMHNNKSLLGIYKKMFTELTSKLEEYETFLKHHKEIFNSNTAGKQHGNTIIKEQFKNIETKFTNVKDHFAKVKKTFVVLEDTNEIRKEVADDTKKLISSTVNLISAVGLNFDKNDINTIKEINIEHLISEQQSIAPIFEAQLISMRYVDSNYQDQNLANKEYLLSLSNFCQENYKKNNKPIIVKVNRTNDSTTGSDLEDRIDYFVYGEKEYGHTISKLESTSFTNCVFPTQPSIKYTSNLWHSDYIKINSTDLSANQINAIKHNIIADATQGSVVIPVDIKPDITQEAMDLAKAVVEQQQALQKVMAEQKAEHEKALAEEILAHQNALNEQEVLLNKQHSDKINLITEEAGKKAKEIQDKLQKSELEVFEKTEELKKLTETVKEAANSIENNTVEFLGKVRKDIHTAQYCLGGFSFIYHADDTKPSNVKDNEIALVYNKESKSYTCYYKVVSNENKLEQKSHQITIEKINQHLRQVQEIQNVAAEQRESNLSGESIDTILDQLFPSQPVYWKEQIKDKKMGWFLKKMGDSLSQTMESITEYIAKFKDTFTQLNTNMGKIQESVKHLEEAINAYKTAVNNQIQALTQENAFLKKQLEEANLKLETTLKTVTELQEKLTLQEQKLEEAKITKSNEDNEKARKEEEAKKAEVTRNEEEARKEKAREEEAKKAAAAKKEHEKAVQEKARQIQTMEDALNQLKKERDEANKKLKMKEKYEDVLYKFITEPLKISQTKSETDAKTTALVALKTKLSKAADRSELNYFMKQFIAVAMQKRKNRGFAWFGKKTQVGGKLVELLIADFKKDRENSLLFKLWGGNNNSKIPTTYSEIAAAVAEDLHLHNHTEHKNFEFFGGELMHKNNEFKHDYITVKHFVKLENKRNKK